MAGIRFCFTRPADGGVSVVHGVSIEQMSKSLKRELTEAEYVKEVKSAIPMDALNVRQLADDEILPPDRTARGAWKNGPSAIEVDQAEAAKLALESLKSDVKAECQRRIYAVVDQVAQVNLAAAAAGGVLTTDQKDAYRSSLTWIASMRARCGELIATREQTFAVDRHWPATPAEVIAIAKAF